MENVCTKNENLRVNRLFISSPILVTCYLETKSFRHSILSSVFDEKVFNARDKLSTKNHDQVIFQIKHLK